MQSIDLNCDMGESFGAYTIGSDAALMDHVTSINIACGFHAGDPSVMRQTVATAIEKNVAIGAHPGYPDLQGFGRREMKLSGDEVYDSVLYQIGALSAFTNARGVHIHHVKPHGALYNAAAKDRVLAKHMAKAVYDFDPKLLYVGLSGSVMIEEAKSVGLKTASEVFADRTYQDDGSLTPRNQPNALITNPEKAAEQVLQMVIEGQVTTVAGKKINVVADTICIHGDSKTALTFAQTIFNLLSRHHVRIARI